MMYTASHMRMCITSNYLAATPRDRYMVGISRRCQTVHTRILPRLKFRGLNGNIINTLLVVSGLLVVRTELHLVPLGVQYPGLYLCLVSFIST